MSDTKSQSEFPLRKEGVLRQQEHLLLDRFELPHERSICDLAEITAADIRSVWSSLDRFGTGNLRGLHGYLLAWTGAPIMP